VTRKNRTVPFFCLCEILYFLSPTSRTKTWWARVARTWTHRRRSLSGAKSAAIKNPLDIFTLTLYTGYLTFFHFFDSCSYLKDFM